MAKIIPMPMEGTASKSTPGDDSALISPLPVASVPRFTAPVVSQDLFAAVPMSNGVPTLIPTADFRRGLPQPRFTTLAGTPRVGETTPRQPDAAPARTGDPMRVVNPTAAKSFDTDAFSDFVGGGRVNVAPLVNDPEVRRLAGDGDMAALTKAGKRAASQVPASMRRALNLSPDDLKRFQSEGVSALTDEQRQTLHDAFADQRITELKALGGSSGYVDGRRSEQLFAWIDRFDTNGKGGSIDLVEKADANRLTPSGRVLQRVLENASTSTSATERDFVAGFRNGVIDPAAVAANKDALQKLGIYDMLRDRTANGIPAQLTVPQLRALYRAIDKVDQNGSADSLLLRNGAPENRSGNFPFNINGQAPTTATESGRAVATLNNVFKTNHRYGEGEPPPVPFDVPPPSPTDTGDPLQQTTNRLSEQPTVDRETFRDFMRDARINLDAMSPADREAMTRLGITYDELKAVAAPNGTIGGPNAEMAKLFELLRSKQKPGSRQLVVYNGQNSFAPTNVGQALHILERYTSRYDLTSADRLKQDLDGERVQLDAFGKPAPGQSGKTVRDALKDLGFDAAGFETWARGASNRLDGSTAATEIFSRMRSQGEYGDPRPGTVSLGALTETGNARSRAGQILDLLHTSGALAASDQRFRSYATADGAMAAPPGTRNITLPYTHYVMRGSTDCLLRVADTLASAGGRRIRIDGNGSWVASSGDRLGRIAASARDLGAMRSFIDTNLEAGNKVAVGVARLNGGNLNRDRVTDHFIAIVGRGVDERGRLYYSYADSGSSQKFVGKLYVDPRTQLLYAPTNTEYTVGQGGYQVTHVRAYANGNFDQEFREASGGVGPRSPGISYARPRPRSAPRHQGTGKRRHK